MSLLVALCRMGRTFPLCTVAPLIYVDQILKGAKPADLPVEQPMKFELVINLNAASRSASRFRPTVLVRADKVLK